MITLRHATAKDCRMIWQWANEPNVRTASFAPDPIAYEDHVKWFQARLDDADCRIYIAEDIAADRQPVPMGQVRFERQGQEVVISVSLDREFRAKGHGARIIALACRTFLETSDTQVIHAYVKAGNAASMAAFKKAGFGSGKRMLVANQPAYHLFLAKEEEA